MTHFRSLIYFQMLSSEKASWTDSESRLTAQVAELQKHIAQELETKEGTLYS